MATGVWGLVSWNGGAVARATVTLEIEGERFDECTDDQGRFAFSGVFAKCVGKTISLRATAPDGATVRERPVFTEKSVPEITLVIPAVPVNSGGG